MIVAAAGLGALQKVNVLKAPPSTPPSKVQADAACLSLLQSDLPVSPRRTFKGNSKRTGGHDGVAFSVVAPKMALWMDLRGPARAQSLWLGGGVREEGV